MKWPYEPPFNSGEPPFNGITLDHSINTIINPGGNIFDSNELYYYDCCVMVIEFIMWYIVILLLIVFVVWFMEGYYLQRYDNDITRYWRDHIVGETDDDFWYDIFDLVVVIILIGMNISFNNFPYLRND